MSNGINSAGQTPRSDPAVDFARATERPNANVPAPQPVVTPAPGTQDLRLNIERDPGSGSFVYKFVDPTSGRVVQQFPDEEILKMRAAAEYSAGRVVSTRA